MKTKISHTVSSVLPVLETSDAFSQRPKENMQYHRHPFQLKPALDSTKQNPSIVPEISNFPLLLVVFLSLSWPLSGHVLSNLFFTVL